jgi:hypothetical protein
MTEPTTGTRRATNLTDAVPTDALKDAGQQLLGLLVQRAAQAATERVGGLTDRLNVVSENGGQGLKAALGGDREDEDGESPVRSALGSGVGSLKEKIKSVFGGGKGGQGKKLKVTNVVESIDVGLPLRTTYDLWTQFADFPSFMKKVKSVEQASDEKANWKAQVFLSHRTWEATIAEQVPDSHIVWRSKGAKGHVDGAVSFTELGPNLTRVLLVLEYWPQGLFERTGNLWRAQGRRARLEFKHFRRHAMTNVLLHQDEVNGWRGEIHDSEVVRTHEEAIEEEQQQAQDEETGPPDVAVAERDDLEDAEEGDLEAEADEPLDDDREVAEGEPHDNEDDWDEVESEDAESADAESDAESEDAESADAESADAESGDAESGDAESAGAESADAESAAEAIVEERTSGNGRARRRRPVAARSTRRR